ncbi:hypothetical protein BaRGS_00022697 [Batillaria attramentaria]|uniref:Uncharacterized protein n=1 Tax=Batillaria attramentaria TaxID=370345 RepID=A0ABD0KFY4_9CAEN
MTFALEQHKIMNMASPRNTMNTRGCGLVHRDHAKGITGVHAQLQVCNRRAFRLLENTEAMQAFSKPYKCSLL